jgi:hypothetical protein
MNGRREDVFIPNQLRSSPEEHQAVIVIQSPDAMGARGLEHIFLLQSPHAAKIGTKPPKNHRGEVLLADDSNLEETQKEHGNRHLMTCAIVDPSLVPNIVLVVLR